MGCLVDFLRLGICMHFTRLPWQLICSCKIISMTRCVGCGPAWSGPILVPRLDPPPNLGFQVQAQASSFPAQDHGTANLMYFPASGSQALTIVPPDLANPCIFQSSNFDFATHQAKQQQINHQTIAKWQRVMQFARVCNTEWQK